MKCERCKKEHDGTFGSGRFCSRGCANSRSHSKITKNKISESLKSSDKVKRIIKYCKSCNIEIYSKGLYCKDCSFYQGNLKMFSKLNINEKNLIYAGKTALQKLKKLYFVDGLSSMEIYDKYNIKENTLFWFFKKHNIRMRTVSQSLVNSVKTGRLNPPINNSYNDGWFETWYGEKVYLRSSYEFKLAQKLNETQIYYEVESLRIPYTNENNEEHIYIPDFYIPSLNLIIETKSKYFYERDYNTILYKEIAVKKEGYLYTILLNEKEIENFKPRSIEFT